MNRLNIFVDETGEFGFGKGAARLYGVSFVFHEQKAKIENELSTLKQRLTYLNFHKMIHMGELVTGHGNFINMTIGERRKIYDCLYRFATQINARYHTILIDKHNARTTHSLNRLLEGELRSIIDAHLDYIQSFDEIVLYYDGGQLPLNKLLNKVFGDFYGFRQKSKFDHIEKKLFQVADMLTYVDKIIYKHKKGIRLTTTEQKFFSKKKIATTIREMQSHRL